ncbi:MAG TPA: hypothetical protein P5150_06005 [Candidatus Ratteibacteria bacterium]|nr:hypothetical protein [Candidatus Ratteibacteria bacterium]
MEIFKFFPSPEPLPSRERRKERMIYFLLPIGEKIKMRGDFKC